MFLSPEGQIQQAIQKALLRLNCPVTDISLEHPTELKFGDFACNIALAHWKQAGAANPRQFAEQLKTELLQDQELLKIVDQISVAGPGFLNFTLQTSWLATVPAAIVAEGQQFGKGTHLSGKTILVEFTDANPFKEFHIGHLMSNAVGEALSRLFESQAATVQRLCYQGDVGIHIAKALWGWQKAIETQQLSEDELQQLPLKQRVNWLGKFYAIGAKAFTDSLETEAEIKKLNQAIYNQTDSVVTERYTEGRSWSLEYLETLYKILGTKFAHYYFESQTASVGAEIVKEWLPKGVFEESQGAIIFPGEKYGLHTRVFINSLGLPTYEAKELGLAETKRKDFEFDQSVIVTGNEIQDYFQVLLKAMSLIMPEAAQKTTHITHGMLRLPTGKMSSRTGNVVTGESLINDLTESSLAKVKDGGRVKVAAAEAEQVATDIAVAAMKFSILRQSIGRDIIFNPEESLSFDGDTGPYLQYTYARAQSVLDKAGSDTDSAADQFPTEANDLLRYLYRYPDVVQRAAADLSPNDVCTYLLKVAQGFNTLYATTKINGGQHEAALRQLTAAVACVLRNGLSVLGIKVVEHM